MNTNQDNPNSSKKSLFLNIAKILALAAVALIIFLLARSCSSNRTELEITRNAMLRERDSVNNEIRKIRDNFSLLNNEKDNLTQALEKESTANKQLEFEKAAKNTQLRASNAKITEQKEKINTLAGKNDSLFSRIDVLQGKMDELNRKIARSEREVEILIENVADLNNDLKQKETLIKESNNSLVTVYKNDSISKLPVFVTAADLTGGYGLKVTTQPYSKNFSGGTVLIGMEFHKKFLAGLGTGIEAFNGGTLLPIFAELRYGLGDRKNMPYLFSKGGAMVNLDDKDMSNVFLNSGLGISHLLSENLTLNFSVGLFTHTAGISNHDSFINLNLGIRYAKNKKPIK